MNEIEQYEFDRLGYIVIEDFLSPEEVAQLALEWPRAMTYDRGHAARLTELW